MRTFVILGVALLCAGNAVGQVWLDQVEQKLSWRSKNGLFHSELSGLLDLEGYYVDQRPPGLLYPDESFLNYRASFFLDMTLGRHLYGFVQARLDRGFDPGKEDFDARLDEYLLRWTPWNDSRLNLQFGKFATVVGNWVQRHDSWENPLITAPLPYENMTPLSDEYIPASPERLRYRRWIPDAKETWLPMIWGPVYATGWSAFGNVGKFDYALDLKNAALSSQPHYWTLGDTLWRYPTVSGRVGVRFAPAWNWGASASAGPYLSADARPLPAGKGVGDYNQFTLGSDLSYTWHHWQWWAEVFLSRFEVPNVGNADLLGYYIEAKYKIAAGLFAAARWNQELYATIDDGYGGQAPWGNDMFRIDLALGYRFTRHLQTKVQYSFGPRNGRLQQGEQLVAAQVTAKF